MEEDPRPPAFEIIGVLGLLGGIYPDTLSDGSVNVLSKGCARGVETLQESPLVQQLVFCTYDLRVVEIP